jgi:glycosyltransferase involved in cell wall biosynthesis
VKIVDVHERPFFNLAEARNLGAAAATLEWILFIDADVIARDFTNIGSLFVPDDASVYICSPAGLKDKKDLSGTVFVRRDEFARVGGYDSYFRGWGGEDDDFYWRLARSGCKIGSYSDSLFSVVSHSDEERIRYSSSGSKSCAKLINKVYLRAKQHLLRGASSKTFELSDGDRRTLRQQIEEKLKQVATGSSSGQSALLRLQVSAVNQQIGEFQLTEECCVSFSVVTSQPAENRGVIKNSGNKK